MFKNVFGLQLLMMMLIFTTLLQGRLRASEFAYVLPQNIAIEITEQTVKGNNIRFAAIITARLGTLEDLEIFFASSKDLQILSNTTTLKSLSPDSPRKIKILAVKTGQKTDKLGSWFKMNVRYLPDYQAIKNSIGDAGKYPAASERQKLFDIVEKNAAAKAKYTETSRYFLKD